VSLASRKFGEFELDCARFELRRNGRALKIERIPMELLILLAEKDGHVVSRQEIIERLWGNDVFVDTEHGINTAIRKVRQALRDDPEQPRFVQTVTGKGYRFVADRNGDARAADTPVEVAAKVSAPESVSPARKRRWWPIVSGAIALCLIAGAVLALEVEGLGKRIFARHQIRPIQSLAVLPLANLSGDPSQDYYADGMTDELITALAENRSLRVVSRTSVMQYKGVGRPLREIAQALGVDGVLEGSVNRSANRVHINLQLIYAPTDTHVWAKSYDRDLKEAISLPEELAQTIATEAKVNVSPAKPKHPISPEAHDAYLEGRYFWFNSSYDRSKEYFEKAIQLQPDYAAAFSGLGDSYGASAVNGDIPPNAAFEKEKQYASKALELDDSLPEAHNSMAAYYLFNQWDWQKAEAESVRAIELNPNYAEARHIHSYILAAMNRDDQSLQEQKRSTDLDPFARPDALGAAYLRARDYDAAIAELGVRAEILRQDPYIQWLLFEAYRYKGMKKEAAQHAEQMFLAEGDNPSADAVRRAAGRGDDPPLGELFLKQDEERARKRYLSPIHLAYDYAMLGSKEETLRELEDSFRERDPLLVFLQKWQAFDFLHSDPRYRALVAKMGLPPAY
jgi:TolB-like protein/DNA-binding winged helix-turn-helix (wHTH) protein